MHVVVAPSFQLSLTNNNFVVVVVVVVVLVPLRSRVQATQGFLAR
jgi:hypothetical protein